MSGSLPDVTQSGLPRKFPPQVIPRTLERLFRERGLPANIRSDNGVPFASAHALFNLSKLAVWWLRLGIGIERIKPGHPQQNGRHERMHLTLKKEATKPAAANFL
jgi:transposase InsO family protein